MQKSLIISSTASGNGKTLLTMALLHYFKKIAKPFKAGPDFIDPIFHKKICEKNSINLDNFIMNEEQIKWLFNRHLQKDEFAIIEGVMGFYDGLEKKVSSSDIGNILNIPTLLILNATGTYTTILAILKGMLEFRENSIKGIVLNHISSKMHYDLIAKQIKSEFPDIKIAGFIQKDLETIKSRHLGLDLNELDSKNIEQISKNVLENIDLKVIEEMSQTTINTPLESYPFEKIDRVDKKLTIIHDENFSFLYRDNLDFFKEIFKEVEIVSSVKNEKIDKNSDSIFICGGYIETKEAYEKIKNSLDFKNSLIEASKRAKIYAECTGLIYLGKEIKNRENIYKMSNLLPIKFELGEKRDRLGYYFAKDAEVFKGHAFHYSKVVEDSNQAFNLSKTLSSKGKVGAWRRDNIFGTYLHTMFRANHEALKYLI